MSPVEQAHARAATLLAPIPGEQRAGRDARGDARAELLRDEMRKDEYLRRDWSAIADAAEGLLAALTKDFVVATCWASAAYENEGLLGLASGLSLLQGLLEQYWDDMFPPPDRLKARHSALANFYEHIGTRLQAVGTDPRKASDARPLGIVTADDAASLAACAAALGTLHATAQTRFEPPPRHQLVQDQLARLQSALPKMRPTAGNTTASSASQTTSAPSTDTKAPRTTIPDPAPAHPSSAPAPTASPDSEAESSVGREPARTRAQAPSATPSHQTHASETLPKDHVSSGSDSLDPLPRPPPEASEVAPYLNAVTPNLVRAAHALRRSQPGDPLAYRLLRVAVWLRAAPPAADARGRAAIDPLAANTRSSCEAMLRNGKWPELLDASESAFAAVPARFCLDLHRYSAAALAALGHHEARTALLAELAALLHRMPGLIDLHARDGSPLADSDTRALLGGLLPGSRPGVAVAPAAAPDAAAPASPAMPQARAVIAASAGIPREDGPNAVHGAPAFETILAAARTRLAARDLAGALTLVQQHADTAASPRDRFTARTALACFTLEAGLVPVARAQLTALLREADERRLADWEPHLVAHLLDALLAARPPDPPERQRLFDRLSTLAPSSAARHTLP